MRFARPLTLAVLSLTLIAGCTTASAGWTYAPAPSLPPPHPEADGGRRCSTFVT